MALADGDPLAGLLSGLLRGEEPVPLDEAVSVLGLLGSALRTTGDRAAGPPPPVVTGNNGEAQLRLAEARYRTLVEQIPAVVFLAAVEGGLDDIYVSPQIESLLGFTQREWAGDPVLWFRQLHPEDRMRLSREFAKTCLTGRPFRSTVRVYSRDGALVWIHAEARLVRDDDGRPLFLHGVGFDITEQQRAEQARQQLLLEQEARAVADRERERLTEMFTSLPGAIAVLAGPEHRIEFLNPAARELAGGGRELVGRSWRATFRGFPADTEAVLDGVFTTGRPFTSADWRARHPAWEHERYFHFVCHPLRDGEGVVRSLLIHMIEVTEQRQARAAAEAVAADNERLYREAEQANRLKDEFLATLSHELRTPLHAIVGWAHLLLETMEDAPPKVTKALESIVRNAEAQNQLISDLLDVSGIIAGKMALSLEAVQPAAVVEAALDTVRPAAEAKGILLHTVIDPAAGPLLGDPDRLQQVVWNLVSNAIKFAPGGGRVEVRLEATDSHLEIVVQDDGPGIDPGFLPFVFDRFRQADPSTTRSHSGLGLGLAIVRHLVELHGGTVSADNREHGPGAVFRVRLPRRSVAGHAAPAIAQAPGGEEPARAQTGRSLDGLRLLVVDDEEDARALVVALLERCGAEATATASAQEAFAALSGSRFDVLLADIEMPGEDGYQLIRRIRELPPEGGGDIPALALTAYARTSDRVRAIDAGYQVHVAKPVQPTELIAVVGSLARAGRRR